MAVIIPPNISPSSPVTWEMIGQFLQTQTQAAGEAGLRSLADALETTLRAAADSALGAASSGGGTGALGLGLLTVPPGNCSTRATVIAQSFVACLVTAPMSKTITTLGCWNAVAAAGPGAGVNQIGLYTEAGTLVASSADMTAAFGATGFAEGAITGPAGITSYPITAGSNYYLAVLPNLSGPAASFATGGTVTANLVPPLNGHYTTVYLTGQASLPASFTPSAASLNGATYMMYAR